MRKSLEVIESPTSFDEMRIETAELQPREPLSRLNLGIASDPIRVTKLVLNNVQCVYYKHHRALSTITLKSVKSLTLDECFRIDDILFC